jgi:hypothetical protein
MKKNNDYLSTSLWYRKEIKDPYQTIGEYFSYVTIDSFRKKIKGVLIAVEKDQLYRKDGPTDLLYDFKMIESVMNAAYIINQENKKSPFDISPADVFNKNLYYGRYSKRTEWDYFPRSLSMKEFIDPYLVFKKFFKTKEIGEWKNVMEKIFEYAITDASFIEGGLDLDALSVYFHLTKLFEAAHLIDVREVTHVGGQIKNRS